MPFWFTIRVDFDVVLKNLGRLCFPVGLLIAVSPAAEPVPQPQVTTTVFSDETCDVDWQGVAGRSYFMQSSLDLTNWAYAPLIQFGEGPHRHSFANASARGFYRLIFRDDPAITTLAAAQNADFDGDGLSNLFEITFGYDPYLASSSPLGPDASLDLDGDGMTNATESNLRLDPLKKDNPKLNLLVTAD